MSSKAQANKNTQAMMRARHTHFIHRMYSSTFLVVTALYDMYPVEAASVRTGRRPCGYHAVSLSWCVRARTPYAPLLRKRAELLMTETGRRVTVAAPASRTAHLPGYAVAVTLQTITDINCPMLPKGVGHASSAGLFRGPPPAVLILVQSQVLRKQQRWQERAGSASRVAASGCRLRRRRMRRTGGMGGTQGEVCSACAWWTSW